MTTPPPVVLDLGSAISMRNLLSYSVLVSMQSEDGTEEDYFISDLTNNRMGALVLFDKLYKNTVLPAEVEEIYSDGFSEIL